MTTTLNFTPSSRFPEELLAALETWLPLAVLLLYKVKSPVKTHITSSQVLNDLVEKKAKDQMLTPESSPMTECLSVHSCFTLVFITVPLP